MLYANFGTILANVLADLDAWANPAEATEFCLKYAKEECGGNLYGYRDGSPVKVIDTEFFGEPNKWGDIAWICVEYNRFGNRATYGIGPDGRVSCYMN